MDETYWTDERVKEFAQQVAEQVAAQVAQRVAQELKKADDPYLTTAEICDLYGFGSDKDDPDTPLEKRQSEAVQYHIDKNEFPEHAAIVAGHKMWYRSDVLAWFDARSRKQKKQVRKEGKKVVAIAAIRHIRKECPEDYRDDEPDAEITAALQEAARAAERERDAEDKPEPPPPRERL